MGIANIIKWGNVLQDLRVVLLESHLAPVVLRTRSKRAIGFNARRQATILGARQRAWLDTRTHGAGYTTEPTTRHGRAERAVASD